MIKLNQLFTEYDILFTISQNGDSTAIHTSYEERSFTDNKRARYCVCRNYEILCVGGKVEKIIHYESPSYLRPVVWYEDVTHDYDLAVLYDELEEHIFNNDHVLYVNDKEDGIMCNVALNVSTARLLPDYYDKNTNVSLVRIGNRWSDASGWLDAKPRTGIPHRCIIEEQEYTIENLEDGTKVYTATFPRNRKNKKEYEHKFYVKDHELIRLTQRDINKETPKELDLNATCNKRRIAYELLCIEYKTEQTWSTETHKLVASNRPVNTTADLIVDTPIESWRISDDKKYILHDDDKGNTLILVKHEYEVNEIDTDYLYNVILVTTERDIHNIIRGGEYRDIAIIDEFIREDEEYSILDEWYTEVRGH